MQDNQEVSKHHENALQSVEMLRAVIGGDTYETVAVHFGISRTAVERRIKSVAVQLTQVVGVDGLKEEGAAFVRRLRLHREAILVALAGFEPLPPIGTRPARVLSAQEVAQSAVRIKGRNFSSCRKNLGVWTTSAHFQPGISSVLALSAS